MLSTLSTQPIFKDGALAYGAKVRIYDAGTTTPRTLFRTAALDPTRQWPNPLPVGADGCMPVFHVGVGDYDAYFENKYDAQFRVVLGLPGDPPPKTGGGTEFDPLRQIPTGAIVPAVNTGRRPGLVRANGLSIGGAASAATERNDADCYALFVLLWPLATTVVVGGKGASADADWTGNKSLVLPNLQNRALVGVSDMGNAGAAASLAGSGVASITAGSTGGEAAHVLSVAELPPHDHEAEFSGTAVPGHKHNGRVTGDGAHHTTYKTAFNKGALGGNSAGPGWWYGADADATTAGASDGVHAHDYEEDEAGGHTPAGTVAVDQTGSGSPVANLQPFAGVAIYLKL